MAAAALAALELVADPAVAPYLRARAPEGAQAAAQLARGRELLLGWAWRLLGAGYGVARGREFWAVHLADDPRNCLTLCTDEAAARDAARWWAGQGRLHVTHVPADHPLPEAYVALGVALQWRRPSWLGPQKNFSPDP